MKKDPREMERRSAWLDWKPKSQIFIKTPEKEPSKPTEPLSIGGLIAKHIYYTDPLETCFKDQDGRFWHFNLAEEKLCELIPRQNQGQEDIPAQVWEWFGELLGIIVLRKDRAAKGPDDASENGE
jgi:hypothetical protein